MTRNSKAMLTAWVAALAVAVAPAAALALCGDLNNDGVVNSADVSILAQCTGAGCPALPPPGICGTGNVADCGDVFNEGSSAFTTPDGADLAALTDTVAGLSTLHDLCVAETAATCPGAAISTGISTSTHWGPAPCTVMVTDTVLVSTPTGSPTTVLTIDPGVLIKGQAGSPNPAAIIILAKAHISAIGKVNNPIVMTSTNLAGSRASADHGGLMINGQAQVNRPGCVNFSEGVPAPYGGCINNDNSGIVTFFRSEFSGRVFTPNNELNSFTMNGVGSRTVINHVQALNGADDCIEWFGGTVNTDHMVCVATGDDGFDSQLGTVGNMQFGVAVYRQGNYSSGANGDNGFEQDNSEFGFDDQPRSNPSMCNVTIVGDPSGTGNTDGAGWLARRGAGGNVANSIMMGFLQGAFRMTEAATANIACVNTTTLRNQDTCAGGSNAGGACTSNGDCPGGLCEHPNLRLRSSVAYGNGGAPHCSATTGMACLNNNDCPLGETCSLANRTTHCSGTTTSPCSGCDFYAYENTNEGALPASGSNAVNPGLQVASDYFTRTCTVATGVCPSAYSFNPTFTGSPPSPIDCRTLSDSAAGFFKSNAVLQADFIGAIKPGSSPGQGIQQDWVADGFAQGWLSFTYK